MTIRNGTEQPGRDSAPAFASGQRRDFDGWLLERSRFPLTRADAPAYLRLKHDWSGGRNGAFAFGSCCRQEKTAVIAAHIRELAAGPYYFEQQH